MLRKAIALAAVLGLAGGLLGAVGSAVAATTEKEPKEVSWPSDGPFGKFDQVQLQRGYKVYHDVCSSCHSMQQLHYFDLARPYAPFFNETYKNPNENAYVKAIAAEFQVPDIDPDTGDIVQRPATPADRFKAPFPNEAAARASNGGAYPPDLSVITKAREGGPRYIYSLLTGYVTPPPGLAVPAGKYYNPYMPGDVTSYWTGKGPAPEGGFLSMPFQLTPERVTYDDGTKATTDQMAKDVTAFLIWASDVHQIERKKMGLTAMIYLLLLAGVVYASYRQIWRKLH